MGKILLCSGRHDFADAGAISVVSQIKDGDNPVSLILAERILGYNSVFVVESHKTFLGVP